MIDFKDINKLLKYNWSMFFVNCEPKGNLLKMTDNEYKKIFNAGVCRLVGEIINLIGSLLLVSTILELGDQTLKVLGISNNIGFSTFIGLIIILILFGYFLSKRDKEQKSQIYIVIMALIVIDSVGTLVKLIGFISSLFINPLSALFGLISIFFILMGNIGLISGLIDFCERAKVEYDKEHTVKTMDSEIIMKPIDVNDVADHTIKKCPYCDNEVNSSANFCKFCGSKL